MGHEADLLHGYGRLLCAEAQEGRLRIHDVSLRSVRDSNARIPGEEQRCDEKAKTTSSEASREEVGNVL